MKVTVSPTGEISIDTNGSDLKDVAAFLRELQGQSQPAHSHKKKASEPSAAPSPSPAPRQISPQLYETWEWMVAHDRPAGLTVDEISMAFNLKQATTIYRLNQLKKASLVYVVKRGFYRAGEKQ